MKLYDSKFYAYINGDILISPKINSVFKKIDLILYYKRIYITSDRHNVYINNTKNINISDHSDLYRKSEKFTRCGMDTFITTKTTFNSKQMNVLNNLTIGRIGIDNILLGMAIKDRNIITLDLSEAVEAIHVKYIIANKTDRIKKVDYNWNKYIAAKFKSDIIGYACLNRIRCKYDNNKSLFEGNKKCIDMN